MTIKNPVIWLYWENAENRLEPPEIIKRCKKIYEKYNIIILNEKTIHDYLPDLIDCSRLLFLAQKVDYYRAKLLYEYGGIWIDFDTILLDNIDYIYHDMINDNYEASLTGADNVSFLVFKPKSIITKLWCEYCEEYIKSDKHVHWASLGGIALSKVSEEFKDKVKFIDNNFRYSLGYKDEKYKKYYSKDPRYIKKILNDIKEKKPKIITLYGTFMYDIPIEEGCLLNEMYKLG